MRPMVLLLAAVCLAAFLGAVPFVSADVAELCPVEIMCITAEDGGITVTADGGLAASGADLPTALENLRAAATGRLLLDTVDELTLTNVTPTPQALLDCGLRPAVRVFRSPPVADADALAAYLAKWDGGMTLGMWSEEPTLPLPRLQPCRTGLRMAD